jgi:F0F1-type ATP synthase assembly protein I
MGKATEQSKTQSDPQQLFMGTMLGMSWQLALVVLVPIFGGYKLDTHFNTSPYLTLTGLVVAMFGMVFIIRRSIQELNKYMAKDKEKEK